THLSSTDVPAITKGFPALEFLFLDPCWLPGPQGPVSVGDQELFIYPNIRVIRFIGNIFKHFITCFTCPSLQRLELDKRHRPNHADSPDRRSGEVLGEFIQRCRPSGLTLHLASRLPTDFLNAFLSVSRPGLTTIDVLSLPCLRLDGDESAAPLSIPSSIQRIQRHDVVPEKELDVWVSKLPMCLEDPSGEQITISMGEGEKVWDRHIN
ncbi:hypothetical protein BKA70DRAFT_1279058, partial [Coprinopsis sp. MPI-PUGE-AT-0042]